MNDQGGEKKILTPEQIDERRAFVLGRLDDTIAPMSHDFRGFYESEIEALDTLAAYATFVEKLARMWCSDRFCPVCGNKWMPDEPERHEDGCEGLEARRLRGLA